MLNEIIQGDCLEVMRDIPDGSVDMILADLPYGTTSIKWDSVIPLEPLWEQYERVISDKGAIVLTAIQPFSSALIMSNPKMFKYDWVWNKVTPVGHVVAKLRPMQLHEDVLVFSKGTTANGSKRNMSYFPQGLIPYGKIVDSTRKDKANEQNQYRRDNHKKAHLQEWTNYPKTLLKFNKPSSKESVHPTQKPVALFEYLIKTYTNEGDTVLDNVIGSGTTAVAAINTGRNFIGIEQEPEYVEIAKRRVDEAIAEKEGDE